MNSILSKANLFLCLLTGFLKTYFETLLFSFKDITQENIQDTPERFMVALIALWTLGGAQPFHT